MQIKTGTDIIEIERIKEGIEKLGENFLKTIFTEAEIEYCEARNVQKYQEYAVRFAGKEAIFKALSHHYTECKWLEYEILNEPNGRPYVNLKGNAPEVESIDISLSHCKQYAIASVVAVIN